MAEHRVVMDPTILNRLGENMRNIGDAWQHDVDNLHEAIGRIESLTRELNAATDRASDRQADLVAERAETRRLVERNAFLEAQCQRLFDLSRGAQDGLAEIADQAVQVARDAPPARPPVRTDGTTTVRPVPPPPPPSPPSATRGSTRTLQDVRRSDDGLKLHEPEDDGTGLPQDPPAFLRTSIPINEFTRRAAE